MAEKKDYYDNGFIYTNYEEVKKPRGFSWDERYPVSGTHSFKDGQDVTGQYLIIQQVKRERENWVESGSFEFKFTADNERRIVAIPATPPDELDREAQSLIESFGKLSGMSWNNAKQCAIIHCDLMLKINPKWQHYINLKAKIESL